MFTGSKEFNVKKRNVTLYKLNGDRYKTDTEKDIFSILGLQYVEPIDS